MMLRDRQPQSSCGHSARHLRLTLGVQTVTSRLSAGSHVEWHRLFTVGASLMFCTQMSVHPVVLSLSTIPAQLSSVSCTSSIHQVFRLGLVVLGHSEAATRKPMASLTGASEAGDYTTFPSLVPVLPPQAKSGVPHLPCW